MSRLDGIEAWTGTRLTTCPWRPFAAPADPFVMRVLNAYPWWEKGQLEIIEPDAPHRVIAGLSHYHRVWHQVDRHVVEAEIKRRAQEAAERGRA